MPCVDHAPAGLCSGNGQCVPVPGSATDTMCVCNDGYFGKGDFVWSPDSDCALHKPSLVIWHSVVAAVAAVALCVVLHRRCSLPGRSTPTTSTLSATEESKATCCPALWAWPNVYFTLATLSITAGISYNLVHVVGYTVNFEPELVMGRHPIVPLLYLMWLLNMGAGNVPRGSPAAAGMCF
jgi:hypothetical protein